MTLESLHGLFTRLPTGFLLEAIGEERIRSVQAVVGRRGGRPLDNSPSALAEVLVFLRGEQALEDPRLRAQVLALLPPDELHDLAKRLARQSFEKPADNALALAAVPWRPGSSVGHELVRRLGVPVACLPKTKVTPPATTVIRPFTVRSPLRDYQDDVRSQLVELVKRGVSRALVQLPTGAGKTRTMMEALIVIARDQGYLQTGMILWLAHVEELCEQAISAFEEAWLEHGEGSANVVRAWGNYRPNPEDYIGGFVVGTYQKLIGLKKANHGEFEHICKHVRLTVTDEAHKILAPTFRALLEELSSDDTAIIGLTATPGRGLQSGPDNLRLANFFGKNLVEPHWSRNPILELRERNILARVSHYNIESNETVMLTAAERSAASELDIPTSVLSRLASSAERNRRIVDAIGQEVSRNHACLVFACTVEHSQILAAILNIEGYRAAHIDSALSRSARRDAIARFRSGNLDVLVNYGVLSTGFDVPRVSTVVVTRPTTSVVLYSQMIGRGLRGPASGGNEECTLIDVRDNFRSFGVVDDVYEAFGPYWE